MPSDVDELLKFLRKVEAECRKQREHAEAGKILVYIKTVEDLVKNQATTVRLAPRVGLQPMAILDESDPEGI